MWLKRRNESGKWDFDTVETLTLHMAKDLSADTEGGSLMNESDTHFLIVNVFHGATEWSLIICLKLQVLLKSCQKKGGGDTQFHSGAIPLNYLVIQRKEIQIVLT